MKNFTHFIFMPVAALLLAVSATAQIIVSETDISRQAEGTLPTAAWVGYTRNAGSITFVPGPGSTPLGYGSIQLASPGEADKAWLYNYDYIGTALSDITALFYLTHKTAGLPIQVAALNIEIDFNGPGAAGGYAILVFEPVYNTPPGAVLNNSWQTWDAFDGGSGIWWSTRPINGVCAADCFVSWNEILANNPQATIIGGFGINQGSGNPGLISAVDVLSIGVSGTTVLYDFESAAPATFYSDAEKPALTGLFKAFAYPNPSKGEINIQLPELQSDLAEITILNANGSIVERRSAAPAGQVEKFELSRNGPGLFFIKVITENGADHLKVVVE
jgi:hypothetical protein